MWGPLLHETRRQTFCVCPAIKGADLKRDFIPLETASIQIRLQPNRRARQWILKIAPDHGPSLTIPGYEITPEIRTILIRHETCLLEKPAQLQTRHWLTP